MSNSKFLTSNGNYGIDFSQIDRVEWQTNDIDRFLVLLFLKGQKYPIIVLPYNSEKEMKRVCRQLEAVVDKRTTTADIIRLSDYRKD